MFDISVLKEMKLQELQEIAKLSQTIKFVGVKKDKLIDLIIESQNKSTEIVEEKTTEKPKRARITADKVVDNTVNESENLFSEPEIIEKPIVATTKQPKIIKKTIKLFI